MPKEENKQPYKAWWVRKADKLNQATLKTGYEPIIAERDRRNHIIQSNQIDIGDVDSNDSPKGLGTSLKKGSIHTNALNANSQLSIYDNDIDTRSNVARSEIP